MKKIIYVIGLKKFDKQNQYTAIYLPLRALH